MVWKVFLFVAFVLCSSGSSADRFVIAENWNALPSGDHHVVATLQDCEDSCTSPCTQFSFNFHSSHCFTSTANTFTGVPSDHVTSGCTADTQGCSSSPNPLPSGFPYWTAPRPDPTKALGGYSRLPLDFKTNVFYGDKVLGSYNHNVMFDYLLGQGFFIQWKNCMTDEDCNGQRMLFSWSLDAKKWAPPAVLFPNMTTPSLSATLEPGPPVHINGRLYAGASPGIHNTTHDASAQGSQYCLWPDPLNPRNCGPPSKVAIQYNNTLLLRRVSAQGKLGPLFWASEEAPKLFSEVTKLLKIPTLPEMDEETQRDIRSLSPTMEDVPCDKNDGTLKCEWCPGGCQIYNEIPYDLDIANERTHYKVPGKFQDVILYRCQERALYASIRVNSTSQRAWSPLSLTDIPNDKSNLNAGVLPDGKIYLVHNPVTPADGRAFMRDPVTLATSTDGLNFDSVGVAITCHDLAGHGNTSTCAPVYEGHAKNPGPSYPQAVTVVSPAPNEVRGFYIATSNNKEDIWVVKLQGFD